MPGSRTPVLIIGAGPTGLGAAYRLNELGFRDFLLLEAADRPGGLAASVVDAHGFTWDIGGHVGFSHYSAYDRVLDLALGDRWFWHERESWVWIRNRFVPYPFQNNIHRLDHADRDRALAGLEQAAARQPGYAGSAPNFEAWVADTFGEALSDLFMRPYNQKVWGYPLHDLGSAWVGERVALPDLARIRRNIETSTDDVSWGPNRRFRFPERGGTGAIWTEVASLIPPEHIRYGQLVTRVDLGARIVHTADGGEHAFELLLSTMPLDRLTAICDPLPSQVQSAGRRLRYSAVHVLGVGLSGERPAPLATKCWMYFPEPHSPYYRVTVFSNYSPNNVPAGGTYWSLMAEVCESPAKPVDSGRLADDTVSAMRRDRLTGDSEVVSVWHYRADHGYPTPFLGRDEVLADIQPALEQRGVFSRGRFGGWKYEVSNQDHSFMQGAEWADFIVRGRPEITYFDPNRANSGEFLSVQP